MSHGRVHVLALLLATVALCASAVTASAQIGAELKVTGPPPSADGKGPDPDLTFRAEVPGVTAREGRDAMVNQRKEEASAFARTLGVSEVEATKRLDWQARASKLSKARRVHGPP